MEDNYVIKSQNGISIYGVFDGHGGNYILSSPRRLFYLFTPIFNKTGLNSRNIKQTFLDIDENFYNFGEETYLEQMGTASIIMVIKIHFLQMQVIPELFYMMKMVYFWYKRS